MEGRRRGTSKSGFGHSNTRALERHDDGLRRGKKKEICPDDDDTEGGGRNPGNRHRVKI